MKLYELTHQIGILERLLRDAEEVTTEEMESELVELEMKFTEKIGNCVAVIKSLKGEVELLENESKRLRMQASNVQHRMDWLKKYVQSEMEKAGRPRVQAGIHKARIQKNSQPSIDILDESLVPEMFKQEQTVVKIDKKAVARRIKETGEVPTGISAKVGSHLRVY